MTYLSVEGLSARYGATDVLSDVSLSVERGEVVSLVGPSGSGKSSLLRALVGLLPPHRGTVRLAGQVLDYGDRRSVRRVRDHFAIVFQQYNLFQNMTVLRNAGLVGGRKDGLWTYYTLRRDVLEKAAQALRRL